VTLVTDPPLVLHFTPSADASGSGPALGRSGRRVYARGERRENDVDDILMVLVTAVLWAIPVVAAWALVYSAVLAALRRHDRDRAVASPPRI
jgi:hypothetical protein